MKLNILQIRELKELEKIRIVNKNKQRQLFHENLDGKNMQMKRWSLLLNMIE